MYSKNLSEGKFTPLSTFADINTLNLVKTFHNFFCIYFLLKYIAHDVLHGIEKSHENHVL